MAVDFRRWVTEDFTAEATQWLIQADATWRCREELVPGTGEGDGIAEEVHLVGSSTDPTIKVFCTGLRSGEMVTQICSRT